MPLQGQLAAINSPSSGGRLGECNDDFDQKMNGPGSEIDHSFLYRFGVWNIIFTRVRDTYTDADDITKLSTITLEVKLRVHQLLCKWYTIYFMFSPHITVVLKYCYTTVFF